MTDAKADKLSDPKEIRRKLNHDTAKIHWRELKEAHQQGLVIRVSTELDLIEVGCQFSLDNSAQVQKWMEYGLIAKLDDQYAQSLDAADGEVWAVVVAPWVLAQELKPGTA